MPPPSALGARPALFDALVAVVAVAGNIAVALSESPEPGHRDIDAWAMVIMVGTGVALAWSRRAPRVVLAATTTAVVLYDLSDYTGGPIYIAPVFALYGLAARYGRRAAVRPATLATAFIYSPWLIWPSGHPLAIHFFYITWIVAAVLLGDATHNRRRYVAGVEERARWLEETRDEEARRQVAEERLRIARDLHDSVAHSLASISVQAGAGAHVADRRPEDARAALLAIRQASQEALSELRSTLGLLRSAGRDTAPVAPVAALSRLDALVDGTRAAGLPVELSVTGEAPSGADGPAGEAAYRIIQEALTNALRHAGPANARVAVSYTPERIEVQIADDGLGPGRSEVRAGHGLVGMRERAEALGGSVEAGAGPHGGFLVRANLPHVPTPALEAR